VVNIFSLVFSFDSSFYQLLLHGVICEVHLGFLFIAAPSGFLQMLFNDLWMLVVVVIIVHTLQSSIFLFSTSSLPHTFTLGELAFVSQVLSILFLFLVSVFFCQSPGLYSLSVSCVICISAVAALFVFVLAVCAFPVLREPLAFHVLLVFAGLCGLLTILPVDPWRWLLAKSVARSSLLVYSIFIALVTCLFIVFNNRFKDVSIIIFRKAFHLLVVLVFTPCLVCDPELLKLLATAVLAAFVLVELIKFFEVPPFASIFHRLYWGLKDSKDVGKIMVSQLYLLVGFVVPVLFGPLMDGGASTAFESPFIPGKFIRHIH
jgi:hypothetical protein